MLLDGEGRYNTGTIILIEQFLLDVLIYKLSDFRHPEIASGRLKRRESKPRNFRVLSF